MFHENVSCYIFHRNPVDIRERNPNSTGLFGPGEAPAPKI